MNTLISHKPCEHFSVPGKVNDLTVQDKGHDHIALSWTEPAEPNGVIVNYNVCYDINIEDRTNGDEFNSTGLTQGCEDTTDTFWNKTGFYASATYEFCVHACTNPGCGEDECLVETLNEPRTLRHLIILYC